MFQLSSIRTENAKLTQKYSKAFLNTMLAQINLFGKEKLFQVHKSSQFLYHIDKFLS